MGRCLNLTQAGEYAVASLARLALYAPEPVSVERLARLQRIPKAFLAKVLSRCAKAGIVRAKTGPAGGMTLSRDARLIPILDIIEACEGTYRRERCVFYAERACEGPACPIYCPLRREEEGVSRRLGGATLADMARSLKDHPDAQGGRKWTQS